MQKYGNYVRSAESRVRVSVLDGSLDCFLYKSGLSLLGEDNAFRRLVYGSFRCVRERIR